MIEYLFGIVGRMENLGIDVINFFVPTSKHMVSSQSMISREDYAETKYGQKS